MRQRLYSKETIPSYMALHLSATTLTTYTRCPYAYALEKVAKVPAYLKSISPEMHTGTALHAVLQSMVKEPELTPEKAQVKLEQSFNWNNYQDPQQAQAQFAIAQQRLQGWLETPYGWGAGEVISVEKMLRSPEVEGLILWGKPDMVRVAEDNVLEVVDHKSGRYVPSLKEQKASWQAIVYRLLVEIRWPDFSDYRISFSYLATQSVLPIVYTPSEVESMWQRILQIAERIGKARASVTLDIALDEAFPARPGSHCRYCNTRMACSFYDGQEDYAATAH